ncbi:MAG: TonB-dependent receptor family protein, partial [Pseudomonadota bacterium]
SHGLRRVAASGGGSSGAWNGHVSAWRMDYDGYRDQSRTEKRMVNGKAGYQLGPGRRLETVFTAYDQPTGEDPGGLTRAEVREDRRQANTQSEALDAGQSVDQQRLGLIYSDTRSLPGELQLTTFYTRRDFRQQLPFPGPSLLGYERDFYGVSAEYRDQASVAGHTLDWTLGTAFREQRDDRARFLVDGSGERGERIQDALEKATSTGVYGQTDLAITDDVSLMLGGRYDRVRFRIEDRRGGGQASGSRRYDEFSLSLGPTWEFRPRHRLYANVGTAFETPTFTEFYDPTEPDQGFDPDVGPQESVNAELGLKGVLAERARYELAVFRVLTEDEIVLDEGDGTPADTYRNAGETRRDGVELGMDVFATDRLTLTGAYTWSDFRFRDRSGGLRGNRLPGLPEHNLFLEAAWEEGPWMAALETEAVSDVYTTDTNTESASGYGLVHLRGQYALTGGASELTLGGGIQNLFDRDYFSNIRVNANGGAFYEPAPGRTIHASVSLTF